MRSTILAGIISSAWRPAEFLESRLPIREEIRIPSTYMTGSLLRDRELGPRS